MTNATEQKNIEIEIDEYGNDTWDETTTNIPATQDLFSEMVKNRVLEVFPGADVTIQRVESGSGCKVWFNGFDSRFPETDSKDSENAETAMEIVNRISGDISDWAVAA